MVENSSTATGNEKHTSAPQPQADVGFSWRRLQVLAAGMAVLSFAIPMIIDAKAETFLLAMAAPFVLGLVLMRWLPRTGAVFLGIVSLGTLLASAPFILQALTHPEALVDFVSLMLLTVSCIVAASAAVPAYREARGRATNHRTVRAVALAAGVITLGAAAVSVAAAAGVTSVAAQPGDIAVRTQDFEFAPETINANGGTVSVHLTNTDNARHTFTIDGVVEVSVPPNAAQRATFEAAPGSYRFYCTPHAADMDGKIVLK